MSTYTPIASQTLSSAAASVTFSGIPQNYTDLVVVVNATNSSGGDNAVALRFNSDTGSNYSMTRISGDGTSASSERNSNSTLMYLGLSNSTVYNSDIYHIMNYSNTTTNKTVLGRGNVANSRVRASVGLWRNTAAITSVTVINDASVNFASGSTFNLYGVANASITNVAKATGGDSVYTDGTYWYHTFLSSGTFTPTQNLTCDYLVVAGGGSGGNRGGGGGGGGYAQQITSQALALNTAFTVTVGAGGAASTFGAGQKGTSGSNSSFNSTTSNGGGMGGVQGDATGGTGGNGGGGGEGGSGGTGNQGFNGGAAYQNNGFWGGGGGGSTAAGANATASPRAGGNGGAGLTSSYSGTSTTYGGGGGGCAWDSGTAGTGSGGGGNGAAAGGNSTAGAANRGGGGGGGGYLSASGNGGSGIVIVRYAV